VFIEGKAQWVRYWEEGASGWLLTGRSDKAVQCGKER
jgi:hypothetical protein